MSETHMWISRTGLITFRYTLPYGIHEYWVVPDNLRITLTGRDDKYSVRFKDLSNLQLSILKRTVGCGIFNRLAEKIFMITYGVLEEIVEDDYKFGTCEICGQHLNAYRKCTNCDEEYDEYDK